VTHQDHYGKTDQFHVWIDSQRSQRSTWEEKQEKFLRLFGFSWTILPRTGSFVIESQERMGASLMEL
jgi:hypothetical protein